MWETVSARKDLLALLKDVLRCERCAMNTLKRDTNYSIPQPGRAGRKYDGLMYVGQNPGEGETPPRQSDAAYLDALREVTDLDSLNFMRDQLKAATGTFVYYNSFHFDADIERVAYVNAVRCRTHGDAKPNEEVRQNCRRHSLNWVRCLEPRGVVQLGLFAERATSDLLKRLNIDYVAISRQRSLSSEARVAQNSEARKLISKVLA